MNTFVQRFSGKIKGVISGFDRIVFKGCLRPLMFPDGAMSFFRSRGVLNKNYKEWVMAQSKMLVDKAHAYALAQCGRETFVFDSPIRDILNEVTRSGIRDGRRIRALDVFGKDRDLLQAIADPQYAIAGLSNKQLRQKLHSSPWAKGGTDKQLSARISRHLRLLRDHGLIRKMPGQRKYLLSPQGKTITTALNAILSVSTQKLVALAA